jgi:hypothetical protein
MFESTIVAGNRLCRHPSLMRAGDFNRDYLVEHDAGRNLLSSQSTV